jgi:fucose permease
MISPFNKYSGLILYYFSLLGCCTCMQQLLLPTLKCFLSFQNYEVHLLMSYAYCTIGIPFSQTMKILEISNVCTYYFLCTALFQTSYTQHTPIYPT